jgi:pilus assembly protein CpaF
MPAAVKHFMYDTIYDRVSERDDAAVHPINSTSKKRENVHAIA